MHTISCFRPFLGGLTFRSGRAVGLVRVALGVSKGRDAEPGVIRDTGPLRRGSLCPKRAAPAWANRQSRRDSTVAAGASQRRPTKSGITTPHVGPPGAFCGQSAVNVLNKSVSR